MDTSLQTPLGPVIIRQLEADEKHLLEEIFMLRVKCRNELGFITYEKFPDGWCDELDNYSSYFIALHENKLVGSGRLTIMQKVQNHPYYKAVQNIIPESLIKKAIGYISRDDVLPDYRKNGIQKILFNERYTFCQKNDVFDVLIDVPEIGYQLAHYTRYGYTNLGFMEMDKIHWELGKSILMHKRLNGQKNECID